MKGQLWKDAMFFLHVKALIDVAKKLINFNFGQREHLNCIFSKRNDISYSWQKKANVIWDKGSNYIHANTLRPYMGKFQLQLPERACG